MANELKGTVVKGIGLASKRIRICECVLNKNGVTFPPFKLGTLNIRLNTPYKTPNSATFISRQEISACDPRFKPEDWYLIPVLKINGKAESAYILRTSENFHGDAYVELIAHDLGAGAALGQTLTLELMDIPNSVGLLPLHRSSSSSSSRSKA